MDRQDSYCNGYFMFTDRIMMIARKTEMFGREQTGDIMTTLHFSLL